MCWNLWNNRNVMCFIIFGKYLFPLKKPHNFIYMKNLPKQAFLFFTENIKTQPILIEIRNDLNDTVEKILVTTVVPVSKQIGFNFSEIKPTKPYNKSEYIQENDEDLLSESSNEKLILTKRNFHVRNLNRRQFDDPRPFNFQNNGPLPSAFQKPSQSILEQIPKDYQGQVNNIEDILKQVHGDGTHYVNPETASTNKQMNKIQFSGTYRHPKNMMDLGQLLQRSNLKPVITLQQSIRPEVRPEIRPEIRPEMQQPIYNTNDIFHNYKPSTLSDINLLAVNQFRFAPKPQVASPLLNKRLFYPEPSVNMKPPEFANIYDQLITANNYRSGENKRMGQTKTNKPFSLMLDIYPAASEDEATKRPNYNRVPSYMSQKYNNQLDHSYLNSMQFPQIQQQRYPPPNNYYNNFYNRYPNHEDILPETSVNKPSQMVVHLNLFPKNKKRHQNKNRSLQILSDGNDRVSREEVLFVDTNLNNKTRKSISADVIPNSYVESRDSPFSTDDSNQDHATSIEIIRSIEVNPKIDFDSLNDTEINPTDLSFGDRSIEDDLIQSSPIIINTKIEKKENFINQTTEEKSSNNERPTAITHQIDERLDFTSNSDKATDIIYHVTPKIFENENSYNLFDDKSQSNSQ